MFLVRYELNFDCIAGTNVIRHCFIGLCHYVVVPVSSVLLTSNKRVDQRRWTVALTTSDSHIHCKESHTVPRHTDILTPYSTTVTMYTTRYLFFILFYSENN